MPDGRACVQAHVADMVRLQLQQVDGWRQQNEQDQRVDMQQLEGLMLQVRPPVLSSGQPRRYHHCQVHASLFMSAPWMQSCQCTQPLRACYQPCLVCNMRYVEHVPAATTQGRHYRGGQR
jgi:hypothetical protein